jgi:hypothetical protein
MKDEGGRMKKDYATEPGSINLAIPFLADFPFFICHFSFAISERPSFILYPLSFRLHPSPFILS